MTATLTQADLCGSHLSEDERRIAARFTDEQRGARLASNLRFVRERDEGRAFGALLWKNNERAKP